MNHVHKGEKAILEVPPLAKRIRECRVSKITNGLNMLKRAVKQGFLANYVLVDSWFSCKEFIQTVRGLGKKPMHVICGIRKDKRKFTYQGDCLNASQLLTTLKKKGKKNAAVGGIPVTSKSSSIMKV